MTEPDVVERQLALAWRAFTPPAELRKRVRARLGAAGPALAPLPDQGPAARGRWQALRASGKLGVALGVGVFALGFMGGLFSSILAGSPAALLPAPVAAPAAAAGAAAAAAPAAVAEAAPAATVEAPSAARVVGGVDGVPRGGASGVQQPSVQRQGAAAARGAALRARDWRGELELLERADRAVRAENSALALALLAEVDARYPRSTLVEERAAIELLAHCQARASDAGSRAQRFLRTYPNSVYLERVRELCQRGATASPTSGTLTDRALPDIQRLEGGTHAEPPVR